MSEAMMANNFPKLLTETRLLIQDLSRTPSRITTKIIYTSVYHVPTQKMEDRENVENSQVEKKKKKNTLPIEK